MGYNYYALQLYLQRVVIGTSVVPILRRLRLYHHQVAVPRANLSLSVQDVASLLKRVCKNTLYIVTVMIYVLPDTGSLKLGGAECVSLIR